ncbi:hypothetical protein SASPL_143208 [Salvia splendens]|uniref:Uncharacterized protein n=1 Tax=Salvia splendens TaxID=180675 RepID=A0A8X8Z9J0_SALSN|nr:hypothetical protein SASPL_143208 [Salvia splendens]
MAENGEARAIGIDQGTTYSCAAVWQYGHVEIILNDWGNRTTPSYVSFTRTERLFGDAAKDQLALNPANTVFESHDKNGGFQEAIKKALYLGGVFVFSDAIPSLEWLDIGGYIKSMKQTYKEIDNVLEGWVQERIHTRKQNNDQSVSDFMDVMLKSMEENEMVHGYTRETVIKATILHVRDDNMGDLVAPQQSQPREALEDCRIGKYHIPKGTRLVANLWKLHRDPNVWSNPDEFRPERFLNEKSQVHFKGQCFEFIPFSSGRRMCPGMTFGIQVIQLTLARLLQGFDLS